MVTERMAVDYAQNILVAMKVDDLIKLVISYEEPESGYCFVNIWGQSHILIGIDRLVRDFELPVAKMPLFTKSRYLKNKDGNALGFSLLHEIAHAIAFEKEDKILLFFDGMLRIIHAKLAEKFDVFAQKKKATFIKKTLKWFEDLYFYLPEEIYANKFADKNIMSFVPDYRLVE